MELIKPPTDMIEFLYEKVELDDNKNVIDFFERLKEKRKKELS